MVHLTSFMCHNKKGQNLTLWFKKMVDAGSIYCFILMGVNTACLFSTIFKMQCRKYCLYIQSLSISIFSRIFLISSCSKNTSQNLIWLYHKWQYSGCVYLFKQSYMSLVCMAIISTGILKHINIVHKDHYTPAYYQVQLALDMLYC